MNPRTRMRIGWASTWNVLCPMCESIASLFELLLAIESYLASRRAEVPTPAEWYKAQARKPVGDRFYIGTGAETGRRPVLHGNGCGNRSATGSTLGGFVSIYRHGKFHGSQDAISSAPLRPGSCFFRADIQRGCTSPAGRRFIRRRWGVLNLILAAQAEGVTLVGQVPEL